MKCCRADDDVLDAIDKVARALSSDPGRYAADLNHFVKGPKLRALFAAIDKVREVGDDKSL